MLDVTNVLAGPFAAWQLACLGARVIKVESHEGDLARKLGADEKLRPGVMARLGLDHAALLAELGFDAAARAARCRVWCAIAVAGAPD